MTKIKIKKSKPTEATSYYPEFTLDEKQLPDIKDWEVGKKYNLEIEVEMTGQNKSQHDDPNKLKGSFKITKVEVSDDYEEKE